MPMLRLTRSEKSTLQPWYENLVALDGDVLDRIIKNAARHFDLDKTDDEEMREYQDVLASPDASTKAKYLMTFYPVFTDDGLVAFLLAGARKWGLDVPGDVPAKKQRAPRGAKQVPARAAREKPEHKATGPIIEIVVPGDHARIAAALGFRKVPDPKRSTVLKENVRFVVKAEPGRGVVSSFRMSDASSALRFARRRLAEEPTLQRKTFIAQKDGSVPELPERIVSRAQLKRTSKGFRLLEAA